MPTSPYFPTYYSGYEGEQNLLQDLTDEQIKLFGSDIYYLPRTLLKDSPLNDVVYSEFNDQFQIEMLLQNVEGFGNQSEFISKFGLRITDEIKFTVSQKRWQEEAEGHTLTIPERPNEGDLLYVPLTKALYEIKFVQRISPFFQLGRIYFYTITAEIYEIGSDDIETGVDEIDEIELLFSSAVGFVMSPGGVDNFTVGELVTSNPGNNTAKVKSWNPTTRVLQLVDRTGNFEEGDTLTGDDSEAVWVIGTFDTLNNTNSKYDQNREFEDAGDDVIDWGEKNPFGEYGNFTGSI
jgi:hypothetical protein